MVISLLSIFQHFLSHYYQLRESIQRIIKEVLSLSKYSDLHIYFIHTSLLIKSKVLPIYKVILVILYVHDWFYMTARRVSILIVNYVHVYSYILPFLLQAIQFNFPFISVHISTYNYVYAYRSIYIVIYYQKFQSTMDATLC